MRNRSHGLSLIELLVAIFIVAVVSGAVARTFIAGLRLQSHAAKTFDARMNRIRFEDAVGRLISGADLHGTGSYFIAPVPSSSAGLEQRPQDSPLGFGALSLVLTTSAVAPPAAYLATPNQQFEALNVRFGAVSDCAEVALSMVPVGQAGMRQGLFLREQRPADGDPTQGGEESLLNPDLRDIRFEFYDGTTWTDSWDSRNAQKGKLPSAVRVIYLLNTETTPHTFLVRLPLSELAVDGVSQPLGGGQ